MWCQEIPVLTLIEGGTEAQRERCFLDSAEDYLNMEANLNTGNRPGRTSSLFLSPRLESKDVACCITCTRVGLIQKEKAPNMVLLPCKRAIS